MASTVTVFESMARKTVIKTNPGKYLHEVRDEACKKFNLNPEKYGLKNNGKILDLSTPLRHSGLAAGARLELTLLSRSAGVVTVGLQLPESEVHGITGGRLVDKFPSTTTLWQILRRFEDGKAGAVGSRNLTARGVPKTANVQSGAGRLYYEQPVLHIQGRDLSTFVDLQKTLSGLGLNSGNVLLKLSYRLSDQPLEEAQVEIGRYFDDIESTTQESQTSHDAPNVYTQIQSHDQSTEVISPLLPQSEVSIGIPTTSETPRSNPAVEVPPSDPHPPVVDSAPQVIPAETVSAAPIAGISDRPITVFSAPSGTIPKAALKAHDEADYEFNMDHAKAQAAQYQAAGRNKPLPSDAEIEAAKEASTAKKAAVKAVQVKARFPDQTSVVAEFTQGDSGHELYCWIRGLMRHGDAPFSLKWRGPKGMIDVPNDDKKLIQDVGMAGREIVTLVWKEDASVDVRQAPTLKSQVNSIAKEIEVNEPEGQVVGDTLKEQKKENIVPKDGKKKALPAWLTKNLKKT